MSFRHQLYFRRIKAQSKRINISLFRAFMCFIDGVLDGIGSKARAKAGQRPVDRQTGRQVSTVAGPVGHCQWWQCSVCPVSRLHSTAHQYTSACIISTLHRISYLQDCCVTDPSFIVPVGDFDDQIPTIITTASKDSFLWENRECWKLPIDVIFSSSKMSTLK